MRVGIRAIILSDDDGKRGARVRPEQIGLAVERANRIFASAGVTFDFDPRADITRMRSTLLNRMNGDRGPSWPEALRRANEIAAAAPGQITVFYRHGPKKAASARGFASVDYDFVVMPGYEVHRRCGEPTPEGLAHEVGHHLGLRHTFRNGRPDTLAEAQGKVLAEGLSRASFDGDKLPDTAPDPGIAEHDCYPVPSFELAGQDYHPPIDNIMSYYRARNTLTGDQARQAHRLLQLRLGAGMSLYSRVLPENPIEVEQLRITQEGCWPKAETLPESHRESWSAGRHLLLHGEGDCRATLPIVLPEPGKYRVELWATRYRDHGRMAVILDGAPVAETVDLYAPVRVPTGPLDLGEHDLDAGVHALELRVADRSELSTGHRAGIDAIVVRRVDGS